MSATDPDIFQPPVATDPPQDPPQDAPPQAPATDAEVQSRIDVATANARAEAWKEAAELGGRRQDPVTQAPPGPRIPDNPLDLLSPQEREQLNALQITNPEQFTTTIAQLYARVERMRLEQQAAPMIIGQAATIVKLFKADKISENPTLGRQIAPLFDRKLAGIDLRPLVGMTEAQSNAELALRWDAAEAEVLRKNMAAAPPKPEPRLTANGAPGGEPGGGSPKKGRVEEDPFLARMAAEYKFTDAQKKDLEEYIA